MSEHFSERELACRHCGELVVHPKLVELLERIRAARGHKPLVLRSAYRCPVHNQRVGGATRSQHMLGRAADLPYGYISSANARRLGARGIGEKDGWALHVDVREGPPATWQY